MCVCVFVCEGLCVWGGGCYSVCVCEFVCERVCVRGRHTHTGLAYINNDNLTPPHTHNNNNNKMGNVGSGYRYL